MQNPLETSGLCLEEDSSDTHASIQDTIPVLDEGLLADRFELGPDETERRNQGPDVIQLDSLTRQLYASHFLSTWNSRFFEFAAILFLAESFPGTLWPSSLYALIRAAAAMVLSPTVGGFIDRNERVLVVRTSIIGQRAAAVFSCFLFAGLTLMDNPWRDSKVTLFALACVGAVVEKLCSMMNLIAIERDWVVAIAEGTEANLEELNSQMRRIDLFCKLMGPLFIAFIDGVSTMVAIYITGGIGLICLPIEYYAITHVSSTIDSLNSPRTIAAAQNDDENSAHTLSRNLALTIMKRCSTSAILFIQHPIFLPSMALSILYFTVLSFSGQMVTYLIAIDFTSFQVGLLRSASVILELSAPWFAPMIIDWVGPVRAGLWSINWQLLCIIPAVSLFAIIHAPISAALFMVAGVILSRVGLWGFDLSVQLLVQQSVEPEARGSFSSMEASCQNFFEFCAYTLTLIFNRPEQFRYPILMSAVAVLIADACYAKYVVNNRGHLVHLSKCMVRPGASTRWIMKRQTDFRMQDLTRESLLQS